MSSRVTKNRSTPMNQLIASCKQDLLDIYKHALEAVKPERLIKNCIAFENDKFIVNDNVNSCGKTLEYDLNKTRLHVTGGGKCVLAMARGLAEKAEASRATSSFSLGCLSIPVNSKSTFQQDAVTQDLLRCLDISVKFGSKDNLPDEDSVHATNCILDKIREASEIDRKDGVRSLFLVLISGGGSACLTSPKHLGLQQKSSLIKSLVQQGADIVELNTVRRCFSHVKGGNLARHILAINPNSRVISLILSDVINDPIDIIASGPTCVSADKVQSCQSMMSVMKKYGLEVPSYPIEEPTGSSVDGDSVHNRIIGNNKLALNALRDRAEQLGYTTTVLGNDLSGTTKDVLGRILNRASLDAERSLIVGGGESTVVKEPDEIWGVGGRVQEMALDYMHHMLSDAEPRNEHDIDVFLAGSTDGQDGPTDVAGCFASASDWSLNKSFNLDDIIRAKRAHDSNNFWNQHRSDWLVKTGPSGTNVMDLYMLLNVNLGRT